MKMKTYPERARAAVLQEIEEGGGQKTFGSSTDNNSLEVLRRMKDEGMIQQSTTPGANPTYRTAHEESSPRQASQGESLQEESSPQNMQVEPQEEN